MSSPELPPELQNDQDSYFKEVMGPVDDMLIVAEWRSSSAASVNMGNGERLWCHLLNVIGTIGPGGKYAEVTVAIPLDAAEAIANNMKRVAHLTDEELEQGGRHT